MLPAVTVCVCVCTLKFPLTLVSCFQLPPHTLKEPHYFLFLLYNMRYFPVRQLLAGSYSLFSLSPFYLHMEMFQVFCGLEKGIKWIYFLNVLTGSIVQIWLCQGLQLLSPGNSTGDGANAWESLFWSYSGVSHPDFKWVISSYVNPMPSLYIVQCLLFIF